MKKFLLITVWLMGFAAVRAADSTAIRPFEKETWDIPANVVDEAVLEVLRDRKIEPARPCSDEIFVRRVCLDVIGTLPTPAEVIGFSDDSRPDRRARLIDALLERREFADYWSLKWCDILRVKAEFPINLWPNAVHAYHHWVHDSLARNMRYDRFVRELLTSSGSNFRVAPVNFYRAVQGETPAAIAGAVALTFMGTRLEKWPADKRAEFERIFSRVAFKTTVEWKEKIVLLDPSKNDPLELIFPDGTRIPIEAGEDPRLAFADWLIRPENEWFTRNIANRTWSWLMGRGIIHESDDIRDDNPPVNPRLLACLQKELVKADYDLKAVYRLILNSRAYQQSPIPRNAAPEAETFFACYPVRRLDAEVLVDAICWITGTHEKYSSPIPEPYSFIPTGNRSIELADGSTTSAFLELFGRPARDTGLEAERNNQPTDEQCLHLLNSTQFRKRIVNSGKLKAMIKTSRADPEKFIRQAYLNILSRQPTGAEVEVIRKYQKAPGANGQQADFDLIWALINSKEFLFRH